MTGDLFSDEVFYSTVPKLFPFSLSIPDGGGLLTWRGLLGSWCQVDLPFCFSPWWQGSIYLPRISECQVPSRFSDYLQDKVLLNWTGLLGARVQEFLFLFLSLMAGSSYLQGFLGTCKILFMSLTLMVGSTYLVMLSEHAAPSSFSFLSLSLVWGVAETFWAPNAKPIRFPIVPLSFMAMVCLPGIAFWVLGVRFPSVSLMVRVYLDGFLGAQCQAASPIFLFTLWLRTTYLVHFWAWHQDIPYRSLSLIMGSSCLSIHSEHNAPRRLTFQSLSLIGEIHLPCEASWVPS